MLQKFVSLWPASLVILLTLSSTKPAQSSTSSITFIEPLLQVPASKLSLSTSPSSNAYALGMSSSTSARVAPVQLLFNDTDVPYKKDNLLTGSFRRYYYVASTLLTSGRTFLIHPSNNTSLCLTFSNITSNLSSASAVAGFPLQFTPCNFSSAGGTPALNSQLFKLLRRCDLLPPYNNHSSSTPYILQMWSPKNENGTNSLIPVAQESGPWPVVPCAEWDPVQGLMVQQPCSFSSAQQWLLPAVNSTLYQAPNPTQSLCPTRTESVFLASSPLDLMSMLSNVLGCPGAANWTHAILAFNATGGGAVNTTLLPAACFSVNLLDIFLYDGAFTQVFFWRGRREPFTPSVTTIASLVTLANTYLWGNSGQLWPYNQTLMAWFTAVDVQLLLNSTFLRAPILQAANSSSSSVVEGSAEAVYQYPWSYLATVDHFSISSALPTTRAPVPPGLSPTQLPDQLLTVFKTGIRNLTLQGLGISGGLPTAWSGLSPLASGAYINLYGVYIDLSRNRLSGGLPASWMESWLGCYVTRLDLRNNLLNVSISSNQSESTCSNPVTACNFFYSSGRSLSTFARHVAFATGPTSAANLSKCGLVSLGYSGISWDASAASHTYMYSFHWLVPSSSPYVDCSIDNSCDLTVSSLYVMSVSVSPVPYALALEGNPYIWVDLPSSFTPMYQQPWFAVPVCTKDAMFGDRLRNLCSDFTPFPIVVVVWVLIGIASITCFLVGVVMRRRQISRSVRCDERGMNAAQAAGHNQKMIVTEVTPPPSEDNLAKTASSVSYQGSEDPSGTDDSGTAVCHTSCGIGNSCSLFTNKVEAGEIKATGSDQANIVTLERKVGFADFLARHRFRLKFVFQSGTMIYILTWSVFLTAQVHVQFQLCQATALCNTFVFPLLIAFSAAPGWVTGFLICRALSSKWSRDKLMPKAWLSQGRTGYILRRLLYSGLAFLSAIAACFLAVPILLLPVVGWFFIRFRFLDRKMPSVMCILSCLSAPLLAVPMSILVTYLYMGDYSISSGEDSNTTIFLINQIGHAVAICNWFLSLNLRRDAWSVLHKVIFLDHEDPSPWHIYPEQQAAEEYCTAFPRNISTASAEIAPPSTHLFQLSTASQLPLVAAAEGVQ